MRHSRRELLGILTSFAPAVLAAQAPGAKSRAVLYAAVGPGLTQYDLDRDNAALIKRTSIALPGNIQEAWAHPSHKYLYVAWSNGGASYPPVGGVIPKGDQHSVSAFRIDPASGALLPHGKPPSLPARPIFITTDIDGTHLLAASNDPSGLTVHRILPDGTLGTQVSTQGAQLDFGVYGHQVRVDPSNQTVILVTRGNGPTAARPEDPGALKIFSYKNGVLANRLSIAPGGGFGYQVRHLDFHPSGNWVFVTLERQNQIHVYRRMPDGTFGVAPLFVKSTLMEPARAGTGQTAASIHVHPDGRFVYAANRGTAGGENTIAVFSVNRETGEPTLIQSVDTRGIQPRTFSLDSTGTFLAVANQSSGSLALFRLRDDGKLEFARKYDMEIGGASSLYWAGFVRMP